MRERSVLVVIALLLGMLVLASPASAVKVYLNPSIQTGNYSPDGAYQEGSNMQDVASRLMSKLTARGFEARSSGWMDLGPACSDANSWGANCFVALHTDSTGLGGWVSNHGTRGFFHQSSAGWHDDRNVDFAAKIANRMAINFGRFGRGYNLGTQADYPWCGWNMYVLAPWNNNAIPSCLMEGLYHDNWDDVYGVLLKPEGRDAYAQGVFEGICDYYGWSYFAAKPRPCVGNNADGRIEVFARGRDGHMYTACVLTGGGWSSWIDLGGSLKGDPCVGRNQDGRMDVFCVGTDGALYHLSQLSANGSWGTTWENLGGNCLGNPAVASNSDGRLEVFLRGTSNNIYHKYQTTPNGSWSATWEVMDANTFCKSDPAAIVDNTGKVHIFAIGTGGTMLWNRQHPGWSGWSGLGGTWNYNPAVARNQNGRLEVFAIGTDGQMNHKWQTAAGPDGAWAANWSYSDLSGNWQHSPYAFPDQNGALQVFCVGTTGNLYTKYQTAPNSGWSTTWANLGGTWAGDPGIGMNSDGRDEIFMVGNDPYMYHCWESSANGPYGSWGTLGPNTIF